MPTIFSRIKHLKLAFDQETKKKIGEEVREKFFSQKRKPRIFKIKSIEPEGEFMALSYPRKFLPVIDGILMMHSPKPKRPRLNKVFTAKPGKK